MPARRRYLVAISGVWIVLAAACHRVIGPLPSARSTGVSIVAAYEIVPNTSFPVLGGARFGGVSSLVYDPAVDELLGLSDDSADSRIFRLKIHEDPFRVEPIGLIRLETGGGAPRKLDPEGLVLLPNGHLLVSSEGIGAEDPRIPPGIIEYTRDGRFVRQLAVPQEFLPPERGPITHGAPSNQAFEALALTPDSRTLWTAEETSLVQDGPAATSDHGSRSRLLAYRRQGEMFVPDREYAYDVDAIPRTPYPQASFSDSGIVEVLPLDDRVLIVMERVYVENANDKNIGLNRIRLYETTIDGTRIAPGEESIAGRPNLKPVTKSLMADLTNAPGLPPNLRTLDNFEGLVVMPRLADGRASALIVSDDNFDARQRTWFVRIAFDPPPPR